ncbi:hypothetical protein SBA4_3390019 [Candidatus Sulfopaludibacter sp. SbA4]|nr:hypothetical protein SBA4_3390019 [Candidatus Sulfopaludibacter sp. SbA4]
MTAKTSKAERPVIERKQPKVASGKFRYLYGGGVLPDRVVIHGRRASSYGVQGSPSTGRSRTLTEGRRSAVP